MLDTPARGRADNRYCNRIVMLMTSYFFLGSFGANPGLFSLPLALYLKGPLEMSAAKFSLFVSVMNIPWTAKPLWGLITDCYPLYGYEIRSYLTICYAVALAVLLFLSTISHHTFMMLACMVPFLTMSGAFADVLTDKLMVKSGKRHKNTGVLQAAQGFAIGVGGGVIYLVGGTISAMFPLSQAFLMTALVPILGLFVTYFFLNERKVPTAKYTTRERIEQLWVSARSKHYVSAAIFIGCIQLGPLPPTLYFLHDDLQFSSSMIGVLTGVEALAGGLGAIAFGFYVEEVPLPMLLNLVVFGYSCGTLAFTFMDSIFSAAVVHIVVGVCYMIGHLGLVQVAALACPVGTEGTAYATLMSVITLAAEPGTMLGGWLYDRGVPYRVLCVMSATCTGCCWFLIQLLKLKELPQQEAAEEDEHSSGPSGDERIEPAPRAITA